MKIDVFLSELCGSYSRLHEVIDRALNELGVSADVNFHTVYYDEAVSKGIMGSPSVWINGKDAFPGGNSPRLA